MLAQREVLEPLTPDERQILTVQEKIVHHAQESLLAGCEALLRIRDQRLYREHGSFESYVCQRWQKLSRGRIYEMLTYAKVADQLANVIDPATFNERQARALGLFSAHLRQGIYLIAQSQAASGKPTADLIEQIGRQITASLDAAALLGETPTADAEAVLESALNQSRPAPLHPLFRAAEHVRKAGKQLRHVLPDEVDPARALELWEQLAGELERLGEIVTADIRTGPPVAVD